MLAPLTFRRNFTGYMQKARLITRPYFHFSLSNFPFPDRIFPAGAKNAVWKRDYLVIHPLCFKAYDMYRFGEKFAGSVQS